MDMSDCDCVSKSEFLKSRKTSSRRSPSPSTAPWLSDISDAISDAESINENQARRLLESPCPMDQETCKDRCLEDPSSVLDVFPCMQEKMVSIYRGKSTQSLAMEEEDQKLRKPDECCECDKENPQSTLQCKNSSCGCICKVQPQSNLFYVLRMRRGHRIPAGPDNALSLPGLPSSNSSAIAEENQVKSSQTEDRPPFACVLRSTEENNATLLSEKFLSFYNNKEHFDLMICCKNNYAVKCHRIVVAAWSTVIEKMLSHYYIYHQNSTEPVIYRLRKKVLSDKTNSDSIVSIKNHPCFKQPVNNWASMGMILFHIPELDGRALESVLQCIYYGTATVRPSEVTEVSATMAKLKIENIAVAYGPFTVEESQLEDESLKCSPKKIDPIAREPLRQCSSSSSLSPSIKSCSLDVPNLTTDSYDDAAATCNIVTIATRRRKSKSPMAINKGPVITRKRKAKDLTKHSTTLKSRRIAALQDLKRGYLLKEVALRHCVSKEKVRRWRFEKRRFDKEREVRKTRRTTEPVLLTSDDDLPLTPNFMKITTTEGTSRSPTPSPTAVSPI